MSLPPSLKYVVDENQVRFLAKAAPDELAPQLSVIARRLLEDENKLLGAHGILFIKSTVLTDTFRELLVKVFEALRSNKPFTAWLNLDMGSGKTHLLTLLTYLIYSYNNLKEELEEYHKLGLNADIATETAILVVDLRTPSEVPTTFLRLFASSLRKIGEHQAASYIEDCISTGKMPEASEFVKFLRKEGTKLVILIDELHHAVLTYGGSESDRKWVKLTIRFTLQLIDYLRHYGRGFAILVASARRDYERMAQLHEKDELVILAESLISQIGRLEPVLETRWLSVKEAREIILRKIGARQDVLHPMFDHFIERVIKAESDIPQAQHLRSLIKAIAVYTLNSIRLGFTIVTPAVFSEEVIDALFPEGGGIADKYKSIYGQLIRSIDEFEVRSPDARNVARLIVNTIFTASITGRSDLLIDIIRAYKLGRYSGTIPAVSEREIIELLTSIGIEPKKISEALDIISNLEYIHSIKRGNMYIYFVVPIVSIVALYHKYINDRYNSLYTDREKLITETFMKYLYMIDIISRNAQIITVSRYEDLENVTKRLDPDTMYLVIYADTELVRYFDEKIRVGTKMDVDTIVNEWTKLTRKRSLSDWLKEQARFNIALAVPVPYDDVLKNIARYQAIEEATSKIVLDYLLEYSRGESRLPEEMKKLIEIELDEIHRALKDRFVEAINCFVNSYSRALSHVYVYTCSFTTEGTIQSNVLLYNLGTVSVESGSILFSSDPRLYNELVERLRRARDDRLRSLCEDLLDRVKNLAGFIDDTNVARSIILRMVTDDLKNSGKSSISRDMNTFPYQSRLVYIPPSTVTEAMKLISTEDLKKHITESGKAEEIKIVKKIDGITITFEVEKVISTTTKVEDLGLHIEEHQQKEDIDFIAKAMNAIDTYDKGEIFMVLSFDTTSKSSLKTYINSLRKYIKKLEVRPLWN